MRCVEGRREEAKALRAANSSSIGKRCNEEDAAHALNPKAASVLATDKQTLPTAGAELRIHSTHAQTTARKVREEKLRTA